MIYLFIISSLWFGIWATLSRLEFKYAGLNVGKNTSGFFFFFFFFWLGHELGLSPKRGLRDPRGPVGASSSPGKKPSTLNGPGPGHGSCPVGRVRVWKNPARTLPVAIPRNGNPLVSPRIEFWPIPRRFGSFSQFQSIPAEIQDPTGAFFGLHLRLKQREKTKS